jgi:hypothetical protein
MHKARASCNQAYRLLRAEQDNAFSQALCVVGLNQQKKTSAEVRASRMSLRAGSGPAGLGSCPGPRHCTTPGGMGAVIIARSTPVSHTLTQSARLCCNSKRLPAFDCWLRPTMNRLEPQQHVSKPWRAGTQTRSACHPLSQTLQPPAEAAKQIKKRGGKCAPRRVYKCAARQNRLCTVIGVGRSAKPSTSRRVQPTTRLGQQRWVGQQR